MAGIRTEEPRPRDPPLHWSPFAPPATEIEYLSRAMESIGGREFGDVLNARRSTVGRSVGWAELSGLLWHAAAYKGFADAGRAGLPIAWSASPTCGGLHAVRIVCIADDGSAARLYDPMVHAFHVLSADRSAVGKANGMAVEVVAGTCSGCTLRLIGDWSKLSAAYENAETLLYREAGCVAAVLCLVAEWLGLASCPLGFVGDDILPLLGFPEDRFRGAGAVQVSKKRTGR